MKVKWIIRPSNVKQAIEYLNNKIPKKVSMGQKVALILEPYKKCGEFDGTLESGIKCLKDSYDFDMEND